MRERVVEDVQLDQLHQLAREASLPSWLPEGDARLATTLFRGLWFPFPGYAQCVNDKNFSIAIAMPHQRRSEQRRQ